jgi:hypothetical protein
MRSPVDLRIVSIADRNDRNDRDGAPPVKARVEQAEAPFAVVNPAADRDRLAAENARLAREVERLTQDNRDLRESAEIWIRLYENQLSRANRAADLLAHCANALSR